MLWKPKGIRNYHIWYISDSPPPLKSSLSSASKIFLPGIWILREWCYLRFRIPRSRLWDKDSRANCLENSRTLVGERGGKTNGGEIVSDGALSSRLWVRRDQSQFPWASDINKHMRVISPEERRRLCIHWLSSVIAWGLSDINSLVCSACHLQIE